MLVPKDTKEKKLDKLKKENSQGCMEMIEIQRMLEAQVISATLKVCMEYDVENYEYYSQLLKKCEEYKVELRTKKK